MSLTYNKNKSGANIDPWGTPQVRFIGSENFLSILTLKVLPHKYDSNHEITFSENPMHPIFLRSISWSIVSKAFCKSINIKPVYFPDSKPLFILSVNNVKQEFVENDFRNPDWYLYKILFLFKKISVWLWITFPITFETSGKSETGQ